jgi:hypothetical protein
MNAITGTVTLDAPAAVSPRPRTGALAAVATLARQRLAISARTPRELLIPLLAPLLFALVVVPALADTFGTAVGGVDYMTFVTVATIGLLVPLSCMQSGLGVVVDRLGGGLRDLLAAPVSRPWIVAGNLVVAVALAPPRRTPTIRVVTGIVTSHSATPLFSPSRWRPWTSLSAGRATLRGGADYLEPEFHALGTNHQDRSAAADKYLNALQAQARRVRRRAPAHA